MPATHSPPSKLRIVLTWLLSIGVIAFALWLGSRGPHCEPVAPTEQGRGIFFGVVSLFFGCFFLACGIGAYFIVLLTTAFTFNFTQPVWDSLKVKIYFANLVVPTAYGLGLGFIVSAVIPLLTGRTQDSLGITPILVTLGVVLIVKLWFLEWAPLEKRVITRRLQAQGITLEQMQSAFLVGLSNPMSSFSKRFAAIEEDIGALWVGPEQLVYYGDNERFAIARAQILQIERKADNRSTTMLGGIAHVILHVAQVDGAERQIRFHTEALWTMGQKRKVMDALGEAIVRWHESGTPVGADPAPQAS